ncbi:MAG: penicillin-binding protein 2, partial [Lysobacterales bacterium]
GSVAKPFTVAAGLESGKFTPTTLIDTTSGVMKVGRYTVRDIHNYGVVDLTRLLVKSSNVGAARIAAQLDDDHLYDVFHRFGFGESTGSGFPGEVSGVLPAAEGWSDIEKATLSFGYGLSVTPLQLAQAYAALGNGGRLVPATFIAGQGEAGHAVLDPEIARTLLTMLESVTLAGGTATRAAVPNFRVAGKTGTSHKNSRGGYHLKRYISVFAGLVPASKPRLVSVVIINDPAGSVHYGGLVAAPVFGKIMPDALRLLNVPPDNLQLVSTTPSLSTMVAAAMPPALASLPAGIDARDDASAEGMPP